jgi:hypothetical protein
MQHRLLLAAQHSSTHKLKQIQICSGLCCAVIIVIIIRLQQQPNHSTTTTTAAAAIMPIQSTPIFDRDRFQPHADALDMLYAICRAQHLALASLRVVPPCLIPHPFVTTARIQGNDLLTANLVLWTATAMASGVAGALNDESTRQLLQDEQDSRHIQAIFGLQFDLHSYITRDLLLARLQHIHRALNHCSSA